MKRKADPYEQEREKLRSKFALEAPSSMFDLWDMCALANPADPSKAVEVLGLRLVGPFDILRDIDSKTDTQTYRYFYDPPEFITCIISLSTPTLHWGLFRDKPSDISCAVFSNNSKESCSFTASHRTLFGPLFDAIKTPNSLSISLSKLSPDITGKPGLEYSARSKKLLGKTISGFGVNVPYDKARQLGYRPLSITQNQFISICTELKTVSKDKKKH